MLWQPFHLKQRMTHELPHHETERQRSVENIGSCILGNRGFTWMNQLITELSTALIAKNTTYNRKHRDSKIINVAVCKTCRNILLAVEYLILIMYNYPTAKTGTVYKSTDGPAGRPADHSPNSDGLGDFHWTVPELTVRVYSQPEWPIWQWFSSDPDPDPKWRSGTVANTSHIPPQWKYWPALLVKRIMMCSMPHSRNECQWSVKDFWSCIMDNHRAVQWH